MLLKEILAPQELSFRRDEFPELQELLSGVWSLSLPQALLLQELRV